MKQTDLQSFIHQVIEQIDKQITSYQNSEADWKISQGNVAVCIIDETGNIFGKIWGMTNYKGENIMMLPIVKLLRYGLQDIKQENLNASFSQTNSIIVISASHYLN